MDKFAFLFPGQGAQFVQMGKYFIEQYPIARQTYNEASQISGKDISKLCLEGKVSDLSEFINMQLAIVTTEVAIFRCYMEDYGISPQFVMGHSIGEYAALVCAGAIEFSDAIKLMIVRGKLVNNILSSKIGRMTIVEKISQNDLNNVLKDQDEVYISCYNSKSQFAISGTNEVLDKIESILISQEAIVSPLLFGPPMHSILMHDIKDNYFKSLSEVTYYPLRFPILSNVLGKPILDNSLLPSLLAEHLVKPVLWSQSMEYLPRFGVTVAIEMSPKLLVSKFLQENVPTVKTFCYGISKDRNELEQMFEADKNYEKDRPHFLGVCMKILSATPNNNTDKDACDKVVKIYNDLKQSYISTSESKFGNRKEQLRQAAKQLIYALKLKKLNQETIREWIKMLLDETNTFYLLNDVYSTI